MMDYQGKLKFFDLFFLTFRRLFRFIFGLAFLFLVIILLVGFPMEMVRKGSFFAAVLASAVLVTSAIFVMVVLPLNNVKRILVIVTYLLMIGLLISIFGEIYAHTGIRSTDRQFSFAVCKNNLDKQSISSRAKYVECRRETLHRVYYFSVVTWTTLGYGDFYPTKASRKWVVAEVFLGYVYMALFVVLLVRLFPRSE